MYYQLTYAFEDATPTALMKYLSVGAALMTQFPSDTVQMSQLIMLNS